MEKCCYWYKEGLIIGKNANGNLVLVLDAMSFEAALRVGDSVYPYCRPTLVRWANKPDNRILRDLHKDPDVRRVFYNVPKVST